MITDTELHYSVSLMNPPTEDDHLEISRLLAAAIVNPSFCDLLLADPMLAIGNGYQDETFHLSDAGRYLLQAIHANSLAELARQIAQALGMGLKSQTYTCTPVPTFAI